MSDFLPEVIMDDATTSLSDSESIEEITDIKVEEKNTIQEEDIFVNKDKLVIKEVVEEQPPPKPKEVKTKKVIAEIYDPFRDARGNNVFQNINIADTIAQSDHQTLSQLVHSSRSYSASQRSEQQIKNSLRSISS